MSIVGSSQKVMNFADEFRIIALQSCESTMDEARLRLQAGLELPFGIVAEEQLQGRGRSGATWFHSGEGLALTLVLEPLPDQQRCLGLSLAIGVILAEFLYLREGISICLKWPNDLYTKREEKVGGILIELLQHQGLVVPLVGIGINLRSPPNGVPGAAGLGLDCERAVWARSLCEYLLNRFETFRESGFPPFREKFLSRAVYLGEQISYQVSGEYQIGIFESIADSGALIVKRQNREGVQSLLEVHSAEEVRRF